MKNSSTSNKSTTGAGPRKGAHLLAKPSKADGSSKEKNAVDHVKSLSTRLANAQLLADARLQEIIILSKLVIDLRAQVSSQTPAPLEKIQKAKKRRLWGLPSYLLGQPSLNIKRELSALRNSTLFDQLWYLKKYPDVEQSGLDPALHYLKFGAKEGRDPGPKFSTLEYLQKNPQLQKSGENPLLHYIKNNL